MTITTAHKDEALRVSNAALRWRPDDASAEAPPAEKSRSSGSPMARSASAAARGKPDGAPQGPGRAGRVYKSENGKPVAVLLRVGLSDGQRTEVIEGLSEGDKVITGGGDGSAAPAGQRRRGPF